MPEKRPPDGDEKKMTSSGDATQTPVGGPRGHMLRWELKRRRKSSQFSLLGSDQGKSFFMDKEQILPGEEVCYYL